MTFSIRWLDVLMVFMVAAKVFGYVSTWLEVALVLLGCWVFVGLRNAVAVAWREAHDKKEPDGDDSDKSVSSVDVEIHDSQEGVQDVPPRDQ